MAAECFRKSAENLVEQLKTVSASNPAYKDEAKARKIAKILGKLPHNIGIGTTDLNAARFQQLCQFYHHRIFESFESLKSANAEQEQVEQHNSSSSNVRASGKKRSEEAFSTIRTIQPNPLPIELSLLRTRFYHIPYDCHMDVPGLARKLEKERILALDIERSIPSIYGGVNRICLLQLSTETEDFILDTLNIRVRDDVRRWLKPVLEDPKVTKVLHGHDDVKWFRQDFGIQLNGHVDTSTFGHGKLSELVYLICGVKLEGKARFQTADWTRRPLPEQMLTYARLDTHYLIPCYRHLTAAGSVKRHV